MTGLLLAALLAAAAPAAPGTPAVAPVPAGEIDIRSETLTVQHDLGQATFAGGVVAVRGDLTMRCPEVVALYDASAKVRTARCVGPVEATQGARTMHAGHGEFDNVTGVLTLTGEPVLVEGERRLTGDVLTYDTAKREAHLTQVKARLPSQDGPSAKLAGRGPMDVSAAWGTYGTEDRRAHFGGGVTAVRGDLTMQSPRLHATLDEEGRLVHAVSAGGPVTVVQRDRRARAKKATFTGGASKLVLEGEPTVTERQSTLAGDKVTFLLAEDRIEVERPRASFPLREATERKGR